MINLAIPGWMSEAELRWLHETAKRMKSVLEIGSYMGRSTYALLTGCPGFVFAVDNFKGVEGFSGEGHNLYKEFYRNVGHFENLIVFRTDSVTASKFFRSNSIDMIFIDGGHNELDVMQDVNAWIPICRRLLCGHDARFEDEGVIPALKSLKLNYTIAVDSIWTFEV